MASATSFRELDSIAERLSPTPKPFSNKGECLETFKKLTELLNDSELKKYFVEKRNGLAIVTNPELLMPPAKEGNGFLVDGDGGDCQYRTVFALWLISYDPEYCQMIGGKNTSSPCYSHHCNGAQTIKTLVKILRFTKKTRVVRVVLMTLRNLVDKGFNNDMNDQGAIDVLSTLLTKKWPDEEIPEDIRFLKSALQKDIKELSTWSVYRTDVLSGEISWRNPCHKDETFWRQNMLRFEENDCQVLRELVGILRVGLDRHGAPDSTGTTTFEEKCAVACHDIGWFVRTHPRGKRLLHMTKEGDAKSLIFRAMEHSDKEVKKEALLAVQILMVANMS